MPIINTEQSVPELVAAHPELYPVLQQYGLDAHVQKSLAFESLQASCLVHQIPLDDLRSALEAALDAPSA